MHSYFVGGGGAVGYVRTEVYSSGTFSFLGTPTLSFSKVNNVAVVQGTTGPEDVELSADTPNPVAVELESSNVPPGTVLTVKVAQDRGNPSSVSSTALAGTMSHATASANVTILMGLSTMYAQATFTILASLGDALSTYAQGERVDQVRLETALNGESTTTLITVSGKEFVVPPALLAMAGNVIN